MFVNFNILNQLGSPAINSNTFANRPAAGQTGRLFVSTDTFEIYRDNGTTWDLIGGPGSSTITGTGTATQVAYFTSSQAIGSSANLYWDNTSGFLGVGTAAPTTRIEAVKTDGIGIYANYTTNAGSGSSATAIWAKNVTNSSGYGAVIEETTPNATAGQYPLLIKHSLSSGTAGVGMGTGVHWQLPDDAGTFKTTQLTVETINAAAATYATRYRFNVQSNGSSTPVAYLNATGLGIFTATPGAALDIHSTGTIAQFNTTAATGNVFLAIQRSGTGLWRIGDTYNSGSNYFELHNTVLTNNAIQIDAATNKSILTSIETYSTGVARGNLLDYTLSLANGTTFTSPNTVTALGATLNLNIAGSATIPAGARSGADFFNGINFTSAGTFTVNQSTTIRAFSNVTAGWAFNGSAVGTVTHLAGLRVLFPTNSGSAINVTDNYALLINDQNANTGTITYTNRWGIYQEGASDLNYMAANLLLGSTTNNGNKLQVTGNSNVTGNLGVGIASPLFKLHVQGSDIGGVFDGTSTTGSGFVSSYNSADGNAIQVRSYGNGTGATIFGNSTNKMNAIWSNGDSIYAIGTISATPLIFGTNNAERARITSAGLVGIGTSTPVTTLDVNGLGQFSGLLTMSGSYYVTGGGDNRYYNANASNWAIIRGGSFTGSNLGELQLVGGVGTGITVANTGNILINTTTDAGDKLQVNGRIVASLDITAAKNLSAQGTFQGFAGAGVFLSYESYGGRLESYDYNVSAYQNVFIAPNGGNVAIGTTNSPSDKLLIGGSIRTAAPNTGTAASWKLGSRVAATVALDTTQYIELDVGGTLYKLAIVT